MEAKPSTQIILKSLNKPVIIKKNSLIKADSLMLFKTTTKRPLSINPTAVLQIDFNAKRRCTDSEASNIPGVSIINETILKPGTEQDNTTSNESSTNQDIQEDKTLVKVERKATKKIRKHPRLSKCTKHTHLPEHKAEGLVKVGDLFASIQSFTSYAASHAKQWYFYYAIASSRNPIVNGSNYRKDKATIYTFECRFRKKAKSQSRGIRTRTDVNREANCQAGVILRYKRGEPGFRVTHVCHHHNHELSPEAFLKLPHGHRLPAELKEEIEDLASFELAPSLIRQYVRSVTGLELGKMVNNRLAKIRRTKQPRELPLEKITEILARIKYIKSRFEPDVKRKKVAKKHKPPKKHKVKRRRDFLESECDNEVVITTTQDDADEQIQGVELQNDEEYETRVVPWDETIADVVEDDQIEYLEEEVLQPGEDFVIETVTDPESNSQYIEEEVLHADTDYAIETIADSHEPTTNVTHVNNQGFKPIKFQIVPPMLVTIQNSAVPKKIKTEKFQENKMCEINVSFEECADELGIPAVKLQPVKIQPEDVKLEMSDHSHEIVITHDRKLKLKKTGLSKEMKCRERHAELPEYRADALVEVGDAFESLEVFTNYNVAHAKNWYFYYECVSNNNVRNVAQHKPSTACYRCIFNNERRARKGVKKIPDKNACPAVVALRREPDEHSFTVSYACHHHNHELSPQALKLQSQPTRGRPISPELKELIRDLAWLGLDGQIIRRHIYAETGMDLITTIKNIVEKIKKQTNPLEMPQERVEELSAKIKHLHAKFDPIHSWHRDKKEIDKERRGPDSGSADDEGSQSRVETRLNNILYDEQLIRSVEELKKATGCDIQIHEEVATDHDGYPTLQVESVEDIGYYKEDNENNVEVDQELYAVDENVEYILTTQDDNEVYGVEIATDEDIYTQEHEQTEDPNNMEPKNELNYHEAVYQYVEEENKYQTETNGNSIEQEADENVDTKHTITRYDEETYQSRDVAVQTDFMLLEIEKDYEIINKLEMEALSGDFANIQHFSNTRGQPKDISEETIVNRFNIEFYIGFGGVASCVENLAANMDISVLELLRKIYKGEGIFKIVTGRSGQQNRKTVQLAYVPLTITFPYEKFKYMNALQEYKTLCSKYSVIALKLEKVIEELSADLKSMEVKLSDAEPHNKIAIQRDLQDTITRNEQLEKANEQLLKRIRELEDQILECRQQITSDMIIKDNKELRAQTLFLREMLDGSRNQVIGLQKKIRVLEQAKDSGNKDLNDRIKLLEQSLNASRTDNDILKNTIKEHDAMHTKEYKIKATLEETLRETKKHNASLQQKLQEIDDCHLTQEKILLEKIRVLERDLKSSNTLISKLKKSGGDTNPEFDCDNTRLQKQAKETKILEDKVEASDNKHVLVKIKNHEAANSKLSSLLSGSRQTRCRNRPQKETST